MISHHFIFSYIEEDYLSFITYIPFLIFNIKNINFFKFRKKYKKVSKKQIRFIISGSSVFCLKKYYIEYEMERKFRREPLSISYSLF